MNLKKEGINILGVAFGEDEKFTKVSRLETKYYVDADKVTRYAFYHLLYDAIIESGKKHTKIMKRLRLALRQKPEQRFTILWTAAILLQNLQFILNLSQFLLPLP